MNGRRACKGNRPSVWHSGEEEQAYYKRGIPSRIIHWGVICVKVHGLSTNSIEMD